MATAPAHDDALEPDDARSDDELSELHKEALRRFDDTVLPQQGPRAECLQARRFVSIPGAMWEGPWGDQYENSIKPEINKVGRAVRKIETDYRQNRIVPDFRPAGGDSAQETADTLDGLHRADSYHFKAEQARDNAFSEAVKGGFGAYRLTTDWADPYDKDSDEKRINPALIIVDADQRVFFDGNSKLYDKSDARFAFVLTALTPDAFEEEYDEATVTSWDENLPKLNFDWFAPEVVIIAEYYEVEDRDEKLYVLEHRLTGGEERWFESEIEAEKLAEKKKMGWVVRTRRAKRRRVRKYTMSGAEVLSDDGYIAGDCIPIVPVYGNREYIDNQERFTGHVQTKMDSQRIYNAKVAKLGETDALAPREVPIFLAEQMPPHLAEKWANQNIERHAFALVEAVRDGNGQIIASGPIGKIDPPQLGPVTAALLQIANTDLTEDDQDGADEVKANVSEEAMDIAATRVDAKSGLYLDNMRQSVQREGEIYLSMAREVYCEPGRKVETMDEDGGDGEETLHQAVTDKSGNHYVINDFSRGKYKVMSSVTEATATRKDKAVKRNLGIAEVAAAVDPVLAKVTLLVAVMNMEGEGSEISAKYARKELVGMELVEPNDEEQQEMEQAQGQQQPDPATILAAATAQEKQAGANLKNAQAGGIQAEIIERLATAHLRTAQAEVVGGPEAAPEVPDGLEQAQKVVDIRHRVAETAHLETQTALAPHEQAIEAHRAETQRLQAEQAGQQRIKRGNQL